MRIPRDISGEDLVKLLERWDYQATRQTGSHIRLTTFLRGEHHITIPKHKYLKIGTLNNILTDVANYLGIEKKNLIEKLFH